MDSLVHPSVMHVRVDGAWNFGGSKMLSEPTVPCQTIGTDNTPELFGMEIFYPHVHEITIQIAFVPKSLFFIIPSKLYLFSKTLVLGVTEINILVLK